MIPDREDSLLSQVRVAATPANCRRFGFTLLAGLPAAGLVWLALLRLKTGGWMWSVAGGFAAAGLVLGATVLVFPAWGRGIYIGWHVVARTIERVLTWVVLALAFSFVITPAGLLRRRSRTGFRTSRTEDRKSYWQEVPPVKDPSRYYRQF